MAIVTSCNWLFWIFDVHGIDDNIPPVRLKEIPHSTCLAHYNHQLKKVWHTRDRKVI